MTRGGVPAPVAGDVEDLLRRVRAAVAPELSADALDRAATPPTGDHCLNEWLISPEVLAAARPAAVLVALHAAGDTLNVLLTQRTSGLRDHAGQIAFPGGKIDAMDVSPAAAALREAHEEIGLPPDNVEIFGYLDPYLTRTGFRIIPVVARIKAPFEVRLNADEVVDAFQVPFAYLMDLANHRLAQREWLGKARSFYAIEHGGRTIWGVTAGILHILSERLGAS